MKKTLFISLSILSIISVLTSCTKEEAKKVADQVTPDWATPITGTYSGRIAFLKNGTPRIDSSGIGRITVTRLNNTRVSVTALADSGKPQYSFESTVLSATDGKYILSIPKQDNDKLQGISLSDSIPFSNLANGMYFGNKLHYAVQYISGSDTLKEVFTYGEKQ